MSYNAKVYREQGGDRLVVKSGGEIRLESGGKITNAGTQATAVVDFTENSGDTTPDSTIADVSTATTATDGTTPGAASLKTDVDARLVAIDSNFADLADKVNAILAALRGAGIIASS